MLSRVFSGVRAHAKPTTTKLWVGIALRQPQTAAFSSANISAAMVKKLRESTGAPMMECKKALNAILGDESITDKSEGNTMTQAMEWLRKRGSALAANKAGRTAKEGVVVMVVDPSTKKGSIVEVNCETDFVSRNATFLSFAARTALTAIETKDAKTSTDPLCQGGVLDIDTFKELALVPSPVEPVGEKLTVATSLIDVVTNCRENIKLRRGAIVEVPAGKDGFLASYVHNELPIPDELQSFFAAVTATGRELRIGGAAAIAAIAHNPGTADAQLVDLGRKIAMQAVAARPEYLKRENVPEELVNKEKEIIAAASDIASKKANVAEGIIKGKMDKFYEGVVLLEQTFLITNDTKRPKVQTLLDQHALKPTVTSFARLQRGEGAEEGTEEQQ